MADLVPINLIHAATLVEGNRPEAGALLVRWSLPPDLVGRIVQVYVNGTLCATSEDPLQRDMLVPAMAVPAWPAVDVQLVAIDPSESSDDFSHLLASQSSGCRALLRWPRINNVPRGSTLKVFGNSGDGPIDLTSPLNHRPIQWWPDGVNQWGFALAPFGLADFGGDADDACGFGVGGLGIGQFGFDAEWASWLSDPLPPGQHSFVVVVCDELGNESPPSPEAAVTICDLPPRVADLAVAGDAGELAVSWT